MLFADMDSGGWGILITIAFTQLFLGISKVYEMYINAQRERAKIVRDERVADKLEMSIKTQQEGAVVIANNVADVKVSVDKETEAKKVGLEQVAKTLEVMTEKTGAASDMHCKALSVVLESQIALVKELKNGNGKKEETIVKG